MKNLVLLSAFVLFSLSANADMFVYKGDTTFMARDLLEKHPNIAKIKSQLHGFKIDTCLDCYMRLYDAVWTIQNGNLYLTGIHSTNYRGPKLKADIKKIFNASTDKIKADWVTTDVWLPKGKEIGRSGMMDVFYSAELHVTIVKGKIIEAKQYTYPTARAAKISNGNELTMQYIYSQINWNKIPDLKNEVKKVFVSFMNSPSGKADSLKIMRGDDSNAIFNAEALRVMAGFPANIFYRHNQFFKERWTYPIFFSEENRRKYAH